jgi:TonB-linked SusC/RagA family outer membrane protein
MRPRLYTKVVSALGALMGVMLVFMPSGAAAQGTVTGRVIDDGGNPLPAAQVSIAALNIGVLGQQNGTFTIQNVPVGTHQLTAQRLGYRSVTQEVTVTSGGTTSINFTLAQEALQLDALVVTGTAGGTQRRAIGNVVTQVQAAEVTTRAPITNMQEMLTARAPGLQFQRVSGAIGEGSRIQIRGIGSVTLDAQPLIFIDGIRANNDVGAGPVLGSGSNAGASALDDLSPNEIESIEIIKGPAAATLYGTEASAGVIQVITKRGAQGEPQFEFSVSQGARFMVDPAGKLAGKWGCRTRSSPPCPLEDMFEYNPYEMANRYIDLIHETGTSGLNPGGQTEWTSWPSDELFRYGHMQNYNLGVRGGTESVRYFVSADLLSDNGIVPWNTNDRKNVRGNLSVLFTDDLSVDLSTGYIQGNTRYAEPVVGQGDVWDDMQWSNGYSIAWVNPTASPRFGGFQERLPSDIASVNTERDYQRFTGSVTAQYVFRDFLTQRLVFGIDNGWDTNTNYIPLNPIAPPYAESVLGNIRYARPTISNLTIDYGASAPYRLNESLQFTTSVGLQYYRRVYEEVINHGAGFAIPVQATINQTSIGNLIALDYDYIENKSVGAYIQEEINWNERVFLTGAVRADDNSAFGSNFDAQIYPKVSATWVISEEPFWNLDLINTLRLRSALGQAGRQPDTFASRTIWRTSRGPAGTGAVVPDSPGNPDVGPEVSTELEVGFDMALMDDRISAEVTYYNKRTEDALLSVSPPSSFGRPGSLLRNLGRIDNWGFEVGVDTQVLQRENFTFDLYLALDKTENEIVDLGDFPESNTIREGFPYPAATNGYTVLSWSDEVDQFGRPVEVLCDGGTGRDNRFMGGDPVPCATMAGHPLLLGPRYYPETYRIAPTLTLFNDLQIFALAEGKYGRIANDSDVHWGHRYNTSYCSQALLNDPENCTQWIVRYYAGMFYDERVQGTYKADFWKLREVGLNYQLPAFLLGRVGAERASVGVSFRDIWTIWERTPWNSGLKIPDPERGDGSSGMSTLRQMPGIATVSATLRVTF